MPGNFVRSALLSGAAELIRELGGRPNAIARAAGVPVAALSDPDILLPGRPTYDFLERAAADCACPGFGLRLGQRARMAAVIGPLWVLLRNTRTVGQMLGELATNFDVYTSVATVTVEHTRRGMVVAWSSTAGQADSEVQMACYAVTTIVQELRLHLGARWRPEQVGFRHGAPREPGDYHRLFGRQVGFNRDRNTIFITRADAEAPLQQRGSIPRALLGAVLRHDGERIDASTGARVESIVRALLPFTSCTIDDVSRAMGMPGRTLQHRLAAGGRSFSQIKDAVRADLALKYLRHSELKLAEIAEILGYSELSALSRSFRRWHGRAARSVRREAPSRQGQ